MFNVVSIYIYMYIYRDIYRSRRGGNATKAPPNNSHALPVIYVNIYIYIYISKPYTVSSVIYITHHIAQVLMEKINRDGDDEDDVVPLLRDRGQARGGRPDQIQ